MAGYGYRKRRFGKYRRVRRSRRRVYVRRGRRLRSGKIGYRM